MPKKKRPSVKRQSTPRDKLQLPDRNTNPIRVQDGPPSAKPRPADSSGKKGSLEEVSKAWRLNTAPIEDLVTADETNSPPVSRAELRKFHAGPKVKVADWIKALFLKAWFAGVICYFFIWGLSAVSLNQWDHLLILGIVLGGVTHLLTNNIYRFIASRKGAYDRWMMFPGKSVAFIPLQILYALVLILCTMMTYNGINLLLAGPDSRVPALGVEPLLFGVFVTLWDLLFLGMKRLFKHILFDAKQKASAQRTP